jgi:hypothetical protein
VDEMGCILSAHGRGKKKEKREERRSGYNVLVGTPEGKRQQGRPSCGRTILKYCRAYASTI